MPLSLKQVGRVFSHANLSANGALVLARPVEQYRVIKIAQTTSGITATLPAPVDPLAEVSVVVTNTGASNITVEGFLLEAGKAAQYLYRNAVWVVVGGGAAVVPELRVFSHANVAVNGALVLDAATEAFSIIKMAQTTTGVSVTIPAPTSPEEVEVTVTNIGTTATTVEGISIPAAGASKFCYRNGAWVLVGQQSTPLTFATLNLTASGVVPAWNTFVTVDASAGNVVVTLPAVALATTGFKVTVLRVDSTANTVTLVAPGTTQINGGTSAVPLEGRWTSIEADNNGVGIYVGLSRNFFSSQKVTAAGATTLTTFSSVVLVDATLGNQTITLPSVAGMKGQSITLFRLDATANTVTVQPMGLATINGGTIGNLNLSWQYASATFSSDGVGYFTPYVPEVQLFTTQAVNVTSAANDWNSTILIDASAGNVVLTLPPSASSAGKKITVYRVDTSANTVTVKANGTETINGATSSIAVTEQYRSVEFDTNGVNVFTQAASVEVPKAIVKSVVGYGGTLFLSSTGRVWYAGGYEGNTAWTAAAVNDAAQNNYKSLEAAREITFSGYGLPDSATCIDIAQRGNNAYALFSNGDLFAWGQNASGEFGVGNTTASRLPIKVLTGVAQLANSHQHAAKSSGASYMFVIKTNGTVWSTGENVRGQCGVGTYTNVTTWTAVDTSKVGLFPKIWMIGGEAGHTFVQRLDGAVYCCGYGGYGQLGLADTADRNIFTAANLWTGGLTTRVVKSVVGMSGYYDSVLNHHAHTMMWLTDASNTVDYLMTCGANNWGNLGDGTVTQRSSPYALNPHATSRIKTISLIGGAPAVNSVLYEDGELWCWGFNTVGSVGIGSTSNSVNTPTRVKTDVSDLMTKNLWACGTYEYNTTQIIRDTLTGEYMSVGYNVRGQAGIGINVSPSTAWKTIRLPRGMEIVHLALISPGQSTQSFLALDQFGKWWGWGGNNNGAVSVIGRDGSGSFDVWSPVPIDHAIDILR